MKIKSKKEKILEVLSDYNWHCVNELLNTYCVDYRSRISELKKKGHKLEWRWCENPSHKHNGKSKEWRLTKETPIKPLSPNATQPQFFSTTFMR